MNATRRQWERAIDTEYRRGLKGRHISMVALLAWWKAMVGLRKIVGGD